jgi:hypothetical protein
METSTDVELVRGLNGFELFGLAVVCKTGLACQDGTFKPS